MKKTINLIEKTFGLIFIGESITRAANANPGKAMYLQYCSSCHGQDGRGSGDVRAFLKVKVRDKDADAYFWSVA